MSYGTVRLKVDLLDEDGRTTPVETGWMPHLDPEPDDTSTGMLWLGVRCDFDGGPIAPGQSREVTADLLYPSARQIIDNAQIRRGTRCSVREGPRVVGMATVLDVSLV